MPTVTTPAAMPAKTTSLLQTLAQALGIDVVLLANNFKLHLTGLSNGDIGVSLHRPNGDSSIEKVVSSAGLVVPLSGSADADIESGTATLVGSTVDVTVPGGVPSGSSVYATVTTPAGVTKLLSAVRKDATSITISSPGDGFGAVLDSAGVSGALVAGVNSAIALANAAGDLLAVRETAAGGTAADHFSVVRVDNSNVKVQAHQASGALQAANTSTVKAYNFGQKGHETSVVRWAVVRP